MWHHVKGRDKGLGKGHHFDSVEHSLNAKGIRSKKRIKKNPKIHSENEFIDGATKSPFIKEGIIDKISETTEKLAPIKSALQLAFPHASPAIEVGYQVLTSLDTIRDMYNYNGTSHNELKNTLNENLKEAAKYVINSTIHHATISTIVDYSSNYLDEKQVFEALAEGLKFDKSYSHTFKEFYQTSLKNVLNQEFDKRLINPLM